MHKSRANRRANATRRSIASFKQRELTPAEQQERCEHRQRIKDELYPKPPKYDYLAAVRGNPNDKGTPQPIFRPRYRSGRQFDFLASLAARIGRGLDKMFFNKNRAKP